MVISFADTELARIEMPPGVVGFGAAEIVYLLARHDVPQSRRAAELLAPRVHDMWDAESESFPLVKAGGSSLVARGLVQVDGAELRSKAEAGLLEYLFARAHRWTRIVMASDEALDCGVILHGPDLTGMLQARQLGSWFSSFASAEADPVDLVVDFVATLARAHPEAAFIISTSTLDADPVRIYVRFDPDERRWDLVDRTVDEHNEAREWLDGRAFRARVADLLALP